MLRGPPARRMPADRALMRLCSSSGIKCQTLAARQARMSAFMPHAASRQPSQWVSTRGAPHRNGATALYRQHSGSKQGLCSFARQAGQQTARYQLLTLSKAECEPHTFQEAPLTL